MTRRFLDDVRQDIITLFPDNDNQEITPVIMRGITTDMVDSCVGNECEIIGNSPTLGIGLTTVYQSLVTSFDVTAGGDGSFLIPDFAAGNIQGSPIAGFTYIQLGQFTWTSGDSQPVEFALAVNGVPDDYTTIGVSENNNQISINLRNFIGSAIANAEYTLMARAPEGAQDIDIIDAVMELAILPTNNAA